jgi:hypothetical protein
MTQNKVQKAAIRRHMAETGESYVVARRIVLGEAIGAGSDVDQPAPPEAQDASAVQGSVGSWDAGGSRGGWGGEGQRGGD